MANNNQDKNVGSNSNSSGEVEKHLTEMKELPGENYYSEENDMGKKAEVENSSKVIKKEGLKDGVHQKIVVISKVIIFLGVVNLLFIASLGYMLANLPKKAEELKRIRNDKLQADSVGDTAFVNVEIEAVQSEVDRLRDLFPNETGLINFVREIELLKTRGVVKEFSFSSINAVTDKTGNYGIPFTLVFEGTWNQVGEELANLQSISYLFRAVELETELVPDQENVISLEYKGFLYVHENLGEN